MRHWKSSGAAALVLLIGISVIAVGLTSSTAGDKSNMAIAEVSRTAVTPTISYTPQVEERDTDGPMPVGTGVDVRTTVNTRPQNETSIAGDPNNPNIIVGGMNDYSVVPSGFAGNGVVYSGDGGATWTHSATGVPLPPGFTDRGGDPCLDFDSQGRVFYGSLALLGLGSPFFSDNAIAVGRSADGGATWPQVTTVVTNVGGGALVNFEDKPYLACDAWASSPNVDNVYISWTRFYSGAHPDGGTGGGDIMVGRSTNGGATWTVQRLVLPGNGGTGTVGSSFVQGSEPEVASNGDVYITHWFGGRLEVWKSINGGTTYAQMTQPFGLAFGVIVVPSPLPGQTFRCNAYPNIETHPTKPGYVFVNVAADPTGSFGDGEDADILFVRSTDGGVTWGPSLTLNDDGAGSNQIFPWMSVSKKGAIHVVWYDTRSDPLNNNMDVYGAFSIDGGATFGPNFLVTDCSFNYRTGQFGGDTFFGDYNGLGTSGSNVFHALWTDSRTAGCPQGVSVREQETYTDRITCEVADLMCPRDSIIAAGGTLPQLPLNGFKITNASNLPMAFDYTVSTPGPGTLNDLGNPAALAGTTPVLNPGQSHMPPNAALDVPLIPNPVIQKITYIVTPVNNTCWADTCCTYIDFQVPVPVAFASFAAVGSERGVALDWEVIDAVEVASYNVYRSDNEGAPFLRVIGLDRGTARYLDADVEAGREYRYRIGALDRGSEVLSIVKTASVPIVSARLGQNNPNPFNPTTDIHFVLPTAQHARIDIFDTQGKLVRRLYDARGVRGENRVTWDGTNDAGAKVGSGVYFYRMSSGQFAQSRKMVLLK